MKQSKKEIRVTFRVTPEQYEKIVAAAEAADMNLAAYARAAALHMKVRTVPGLSETLHQLKGIGRNLNQLAILAHQGKISAARLDEAVDALRSLFYPLLLLAEETKH